MRTSQLVRFYVERKSIAREFSLDKALITRFLRETSLENASERTWGIGTVLVKAGARAGMALTSLNEANDQLLVSASENAVLPVLAEVLKKLARALKDPVEFGAPHATFCVLTGQRALGRWSHPSLVFVYVKPLTEGSTHVLLEGYSNDYGGMAARSEVKRILKELGLRFR